MRSLQDGKGKTELDAAAFQWARKHSASAAAWFPLYASAYRATTSAAFARIWTAPISALLTAAEIAAFKRLMEIAFSNAVNLCLAVPSTTVWSMENR